MIKRKEVWVLSWRGRLLLLIIAVAAFVAVARNIHPFLATSHSVQGEVLVVEGWVTYPILEQAIALFDKHDYQLIITTGGPVEKGPCSSSYPSFAELSAATLIELGVRPNLVVSVPTPPVRTDRTFASALAVKEWLSQLKQPISSLDVVTIGTHARRTQWLFQSALGDDISVGVIAVPHPEYDGDKWWTWSSGVRDVIGEAIAYLYARFLFTTHEYETVTGHTESP